MKRVLSLLIPLCLGASLSAMANEGYVTADIGLQAGPDSEYPTIAELPAGAPVDIQGCIDGWTWCDVIAGEDRGWVPGNFVQEDYNGQRVYVTDYGPRIGIPIVTFVLGSYWGEHYRYRPWYGEREHWEYRRIQPRLFVRPEGFRVNLYHSGDWRRRDYRGGDWNRDRDRRSSANTWQGRQQAPSGNNGDWHRTQQGAQVQTQTAPATHPVPVQNRPAPVPNTYKAKEQPKPASKKDDRKDEQKQP